jgi:spore maturation protein CgeB
MFEATGMGACLLNDNGNNLNDIFEVDREIVTYKSEEECMEKLDYLIQNPKEAEKIGEAGKKRTLKDHTLQKRCSELSMHIEKLFD